MDGDDRLRLFLALRLPDDVVSSIADWQRRELVGRVVPPGNLHVTLAFLGSRPAAELPSILEVLDAAARDTTPPRFEVTGYRETRSVGMLTLDEAGGSGAELAGRVQAELAALGVYRPERASVAAARHRPPLPRTAAVAPGAAHTRLDVVRCCCFSFTSAPVRGSVRGARIVSARRLSR